MTSVSEDIVTLLESMGVGILHEDLFTVADAGEWDKRPKAALVYEGASSTAPEVTIDSDHVTVYIDVKATYGGRGEDHAYSYADTIYRATKLLIERTVNSHLYYCIQSEPPIHSAYDPASGVSTYQVQLNVFRYLGGI